MSQAVRMVARGVLGPTSALRDLQQAAAHQRPSSDQTPDGFRQSADQKPSSMLRLWRGRGNEVLQPLGSGPYGAFDAGEQLNAVTIRNHLLEVTERSEAEFEPEQVSFIEGCPAAWAGLPIPNGPLTIGIDGGFVRDQRDKGWFEVIAGQNTRGS